jgi:hypothetical protein
VRPAPARSQAAAHPDRRRGLLAAALVLFAFAALTIVRSLLPEDFVVDTWARGGAQFGAFYLTLLGVGLLQANDSARRFVCFAALPMALVAVLVVLTGEGRDRPVGLALLALSVGLFVLLIGRGASTGRATAGAAVAALGVAAFFPAEIAYARAPREEARRRIAEWREADSAYASADLGVRLQAPEGWVVLRKGSPFVPTDASEVVALVHEPSDARAVISVDPDLHPGEEKDAALDRLLERWRRREPELEESGRSTIELGTLTGSRADVAWKVEDEDWTGQAVAWQDASRTLYLAAWYETNRQAAALPAVASLTAALALTRPLTARIAATVGVASREMPQLTPHAIELLVARRPDAEPAALFREGIAAVSIGFAGLDRATARDMGEINTALYGQMPAADSTWMEDYVRRVRAAQATAPDEDARAMRAMAAAANRLPEASRARLRAILEAAVASALRG